MAKYKLQELPALSNVGKRRVYPKMVVNRTLSTADMVEKMKLYHRAWSPSIIEGVLMDVGDMLVELLSMGYNVKLDGIGTFSLSLDFKDDKPKEMQGDDDKMIYRKVGVKNINFKSDPELVKQVKRATDRELERDMGGVKVIRKEVYTQEERIARAMKVIERDGLISLADYARVNNMSHTAASLELRAISEDSSSPIQSRGNGSHKVWVKRILVCLMVLLDLFGNLGVNGYAQKVRRNPKTSAHVVAQTKPVVKTDMQQIRKYVKERFSEWSSKGEFEKAVAVEERLQKYSVPTFDKICMMAVESRIYQLKYATDGCQRSISTYDSEKETFDVTLVINGLKVNETVNVPIDKAPQFKADFPRLPLYFGKEWSELNGLIYPKSIRIVDAPLQFKTDISLSYKGSKSIIINFDELGLSNPYLEGRSFNYDVALGDSELSDVANRMSIASLPGPYRVEFDKEKVFDVVEEMPRFQGGTGALNAYLKRNVKYPVEAKSVGAQGRVIVSFVVEIDGSLSHVKVVRSVNESLDREAVRVVNSMPRWIPGMQNGQVVRVKYTVPVVFRL